MPTWTTTPPTVPGVYWWRSLGCSGTVVWVGPLGLTDAHMLGVGPGAFGVSYTGSDVPRPLADVSGEWWGPLVPPGDGGAVVSDSDRGPATADGRAWKGV